MCEEGQAATLEITPNTSWPDVVYYNSFTQANMGWRIRIVDSYTRSHGYSVNHATSLFVILALFTTAFTQLMR